MNLKDRGITVGDLVIVTIVIISSFVFVKIKDYKNDQSAKLNFVLINSDHETDLESKQEHLLLVWIL